MGTRQPNEGRRTFIKGVAMGAAALALGDDSTEAAPKPGSLPRVKPESVGIPPAAILAFVDAVEAKEGLHSFMLVRNGKVAAEAWWTPYGPESPHVLFSLSKSFTSTAVGLAVNEGLLTVDDKVIKFFPNDLPERTDQNLAEMRVKHLLMMGTGHEKDATGPMTSAPNGDWVKGFLALPVEHAPGSKFVYNSAATYMCSAIVQKVTGKTVLDYLKPRLFDPLGIEGQTWETCPKGINVGGWGLSVKTEDIAKFGQLYLQKGLWNGKRLVPEKWIEEATSKQISNGDPATGGDWNQGYGYQFWRCRHGRYRGDGAFGQYCIVMPQYDAVLAITSGVKDMGAVMNAAWDTLLPALKNDPAAAKGKNGDLNRKLKGLAIAPPAGNASSPLQETVSGKTYKFAANEEKIESATLTFTKGKATLALKEEKGETPLVCGEKAWEKSVVSLGGRTSDRIAARGAWTADDTYTIKAVLYETPFIVTFACKFAGDQMTLTREMNVGFGPTERPALTGKRTA